MWHKLKDIFGYTDNHNKQKEITENRMNKKSEQLNSLLSTNRTEIIDIQKENSAVTKPVSGTSSQTVTHSVKEPVSGTSSQTETHLDNEQSSGNVFSILNDKLDRFASYHKECFGCKVTASVVSLGMVLLLGTRLVLLKPEISPRKHIFVYTANISLFGMWVACMKNEWYDKKESQDVLKESSS